MKEAMAMFLQGSAERCEARLAALAADELAALDGGLADAVDYALTAGGKRIRPCLAYAAAQAVAGGGDAQALDSTAAALELVHTYSLIHDDLPAMDNDDLRRGKPTLHRAFDEATAILVGDGLQALAFELIATAPLHAEQKVAMIGELARAAGLGGMVGGQFQDISGTGHSLDLEQLQAMHSMKTGALIRASVVLGALAAGASPDQLAALTLYSEHIGLAFQVVDDMLDVEGTTAALGKTQGKDAAANKTTYVSLLGLAGARESAEHLLGGALEALEDFGPEADMLRGLARFVVNRQA